MGLRRRDDRRRRDGSSLLRHDGGRRGEPRHLRQHVRRELEERSRRPGGRRVAGKPVHRHREPERGKLPGIRQSVDVVLLPLRPGESGDPAQRPAHRRPVVVRGRGKVPPGQSAAGRLLDRAQQRRPGGSARLGHLLCDSLSEARHPAPGTGREHRSVQGQGLAAHPGGEGGKSDVADRFSHNAEAPARLYCLLTMADGRATPDSDLLHSDLGKKGRRWIEIFILAILLDFALILVVLGNRIGSRDLDQFLVFHELQYWNSKLFDASKQWCPLMCSGISLAAEPQVPVLSLSMLLGYLTDPMWGIRLAMLIYLGVGWTGAYLYAGLWLPRPLQRSLAASLFIGNGFFICHLAHGHVDFLPFLTVPLVFYSLHQAVKWTRKMRSPADWMRPAAATLLLGAVLAVAMDGSPVMILHGFLWLVLYGAALAWATRSLAPILMLAALIGTATFLDAAYLWPMVAGQAGAPRITQDHFTHPLALVWFMVVPVW